MNERRLEELTPGVYTWLQLPGGRGETNVGVIVDEDGVTLVDTLMVPSQYLPLSTALDAWGLPIKRLVLTSSHIAYVGGTAHFWMAACYGTHATSEHMDLPPNVAGYRRLMPDHADEFPNDLRTRPVSHLVDQPAYLTPSSQIVPTKGQMVENLIVRLPAADMVFGGAMCSFGVTPLAFDGDPAAWALELDAIALLGSTIIPGQGAVGGHAELEAQAAYLRACVDAEGDPAALAPGPWRDWSHREFDAINIERAALLAEGNFEVPPSMLALLGMI